MPDTDQNEGKENFGADDAKDVNEDLQNRLTTLRVDGAVKVLDTLQQQQIEARE